MRTALRDRLRKGERTLGSWITLGHPAIAEILAAAGFDWIVVDLEHSAINIETASELIRVIDLCGVVPLVRLTSNDANQIKRVLDAGAQGILVPMVNDPAEAAHAVAATRYGPSGTRGVALARAQGYGARFREYFDGQADGPIVIVQIEHKNAVDRIEEILAVPGVDGFIVGPYDLSCSMGLPGQFQHPDFAAIQTRILEAGRRGNRPAGIHVVEPDPAGLERAWRDGFTFVAYSVDIRMLDVLSRAAVTAAKAFKS